MLDRNKWEQFGFERTEEDIQGITVHETGNTDMNGEQLFNWLNTECRTSQGCHYICDFNKTIEVMPDNWAVYHTGKGMDWGNLYTIAIEIVSNLSDEKYNMAQDNAIELIKNLQEKYSISNDMVFFHLDFNEKRYCPKTLLDRYGSSVNFAYQLLREE